MGQKNLYLIDYHPPLPPTPQAKQPKILAKHHIEEDLF